MTQNMIVYDKVARHNFLCEEMCRKLVEAGIDMSDASYYLIKVDGLTYVSPTPNIEIINMMIDSDPVPTYTIADMLYKMDEYPYTEDGKSWGPLGFVKDAPFYCFGYMKPKDDSLVDGEGNHYIEGEAETPIEAAAWLLIMSVRNKINIVQNVKSKYEE